jgi:ribosomal protein S1
MSYKRVNHPSEVIAIGDTVRVQIIRINHDTQRISARHEAAESDPWDGVAAKYPVGAKLRGTVTNITEYGAFVELEPGIEGLVHVSEMSWTKKNVHPGKIVSTSQEVDVLVLEVDSDKRRISLGLKQAQQNPGKLSPSVTPLVRSSKAKSRTPPNSVCSSAWMATWTAWSTCRTSPGASRARTRWPCTARVSRSRPWFSTSTSRRSASRSA